MSLMKLKSFKYFFGFLIVLMSTQLKSEDKIDIWKNKNIQKEKDIEVEKQIEENIKKKLIIKPVDSNDQKITIESNSINSKEEDKIFGLYDPEKNDLNLNMWASTSAEDVRASLKRLKKIKLSKTSNEILENVLLSFSYPPSGMQEKEFVNLKINWLIENNRSELLENFLRQNKEFNGKSKAVQYLVDESIAQANLL